MATVITVPAGPFVYTVATQSWWWSDALYRIHGFEPGDVLPTTAVVVAHKHPEDAAVATTIVANALASGEPFALWHRIIDARERTKTVVSVGGGMHDDDGNLVEVRGFMVDVTGSQRDQTAHDIDEAVRRSAESRGAIEQAKGVLMALFALDAEEAFELLKRSSQNANIKVRDLAEGVVYALVVARGDGSDVAAVVGQLLGPIMRDAG